MTLPSREPLRWIHVGGEGTFLTVPELSAETLREIIVAHRTNRDPSRSLKRNLGTVVTRVRMGGHPVDLVVKEVPVRPRRRLYYLLGGSSPFRREFAAVERLQALGVKVPRALACTIRPGGNGELLITEHVPGSVTLRDLLWLGDSVIRDRGELSALFERVGAWLRSIHAIRVWQRDLKPSNVLVQSQGAWSDASLLLIDLTAVRVLRGPLGEGRRVKNLAQLLDLTAELDGSPREPLLRAYLGPEATGDELERWSRLVSSAIEARRDRRERKCGHRHVDEEHWHHQGRPA